MRKYVIINASEVSSVDFSQVLETSSDTLRYSIDESKTFVKFEGDTPAFLSGKTTYTHDQIISTLSTPEWYDESSLPG